MRSWAQPVKRVKRGFEMERGGCKVCAPPNAPCSTARMCGSRAAVAAADGRMAVDIAALKWPGYSEHFHRLMLDSSGWQGLREGGGEGQAARGGSTVAQRATGGGAQTRHDTPGACMCVCLSARCHPSLTHTAHTHQGMLIAGQLRQHDNVQQRLARDIQQRRTTRAARPDRHAADVGSQHPAAPVKHAASCQADRRRCCYCC